MRGGAAGFWRVSRDGGTPTNWGSDRSRTNAEADNDLVPSRVADPSAGTLTREAARRQAVNTLRLAADLAAYGARQAGNGLGPAEAARTVIEVAAELEIIAGKLRRLARTARLDPAGRRALVADLAAEGMSQREIGAVVGVHKRTVWGDLHHGLATNVPHPGRVSINPSAASGARALRTVRVATPNSCASVVVDGIREPGG
jgi:DNA-directed RNA polymerase specialized sigma24 family protein